MALKTMGGKWKGNKWIPEKGREAVGAALPEQKKSAQGVDVKAGEITLYHGTSVDNAEYLTENGWKTSQRKGGISEGAALDERGLTYLSPDFSAAKWFGSANKNNTKNAVIETRFTGKVLEVPGAKSIYDAARFLKVKTDTDGGFDFKDFHAKLKEAGYHAVAYKDKWANGRKAIAVFDQRLLRGADVIKKPKI